MAEFGSLFQPSHVCLLVLVLLVLVLQPACSTPTCPWWGWRTGCSARSGPPSHGGLALYDSMCHCMCKSVGKQGAECVAVEKVCATVRAKAWEISFLSLMHDFFSPPPPWHAPVQAFRAHQYHRRH